MVAINNEFANTRKLKKTFLQSLQLRRQISPFSKDKTFLSKFPLILFATNIIFLLFASIEFTHTPFFDLAKFEYVKPSELMFLCAGKSERRSG